MGVSIKVDLKIPVYSDVGDSALMNELNRRLRLKLFELEKEFESIEQNITAKFLVDLTLTGSISKPPKTGRGFSG